jgi:hypothetical protein
MIATVVMSAYTSCARKRLPPRRHAMLEMRNRQEGQKLLYAYQSAKELMQLLIAVVGF